MKYGCSQKTFFFDLVGLQPFTQYISYKMNHFCMKITKNVTVNKQQYTVISCLFREQSKLFTRDAGDDLRVVA